MIATGTTEAKVSLYFFTDCAGSRCLDCNLDHSRQTHISSQSNALPLFCDSRNTKNESGIYISTRRIVAELGYILTNPETGCYALHVTLRCHSLSGRQIFNMYHRRMPRLSIRRIQSSTQSCARARGAHCFAQMAINNRIGSSGVPGPPSRIYPRCRPISDPNSFINCRKRP